MRVCVLMPIFLCCRDDTCIELNVFIMVMIALIRDSLWRKHRLDYLLRMYVVFLYIVVMFILWHSIAKNLGCYTSEISTFCKDKLRILLFLLILLEKLTDAFNWWLVQIIFQQMH